jgi:hypothetical protein
VEEWQAKVFTHDMIVTKDGRKMRTRIEENRWGSVTGFIDMYDETEQRWRPVGHFDRSLDYGGGTVENEHMYIGTLANGYIARDLGRPLTQDDIDFATSAKNSGFQSIFNPMSFQWYKAAGFDEVEVTAIDDGSYVWGRVGFRPRSPRHYRKVADAVAEEVDKFRRGKRSIVRNEEQAQLLKALIDESRSITDETELIRRAPGIMEFSIIFDHGSQSKGGAQRIRDFFVANAANGTGYFDLRGLEALQ